MKTKILIVDDERDLCDILRFNLGTAGYEPLVAYSAAEALQMPLDEVGLLLLDIMMPGMSGLELARMLKANPQTALIPIIFLTARDAEEDTLAGFSLGADDYIAKPFSVREVLARVGAVLKRSQMAVPSKVVAYEGILMNVDAKAVTVDAVEVSFTKTEFELLRLLIEHRGQVLSRQELLSRAWPSDVVVTDRTVDVNITRIRKKIGAYASHLGTRQGYGYYFE